MNQKVSPVFEPFRLFQNKCRDRTLKYQFQSFSHYKLGIGHTEQYPCGTGSQTTEYLPASCTEACGICDALPPSSRRLEFPSDEREEKEEVIQWLFSALTGGEDVFLSTSSTASAVFQRNAKHCAIWILIARLRWKFVIAQPWHHNGVNMRNE